MKEAKTYVAKILKLHKSLLNLYKTHYTSLDITIDINREYPLLRK